MSSISDIDLDLEKLFQPAWAQEKPATNRFDRFTGNEGVKPERRFNDKPGERRAPRGIFGFPKQKSAYNISSSVSMGDNYQLAIIGSGSGGREAARLAARNGLRTALIERDHIGGACFHSGCYAVLTLQASAREFRDRWRSGRFGNKIDLLQETLRNWMVTRSNTGLARL